MGDLVVNEEGVARGIERVLASRGLNLGRGQQQPNFQRIYPTKAAGGSPVAIQGNSYQAMYNLGGVSPGAEMKVAGRCYSLTLDPEFTAAYAVIYVHFGNPADFITMRPGETYDVPGGFEKFWAWHGYKQVADIITVGALLNYGGVAWLAGTVPGARPNFLPRPARGLASLLASWALVANAPVENTGALGAAGAAAFPSCGLQGMRLGFFCFDNAGPDAYVPAPADLNVTVRPWVLMRATTATADHGAGVTPNVSGTVDRIDAAAWVPNQENDIQVTQLSRCFDRPVSPGALAVTFQVVGAIVGAGVSKIAVAVEGY